MIVHVGMTANCQKCANTTMQDDMLICLDTNEPVMFEGDCCCSTFIPLEGRNPDNSEE